MLKKTGINCYIIAWWMGGWVDGWMGGCADGGENLFLFFSFPLIDYYFPSFVVCLASC